MDTIPSAEFRKVYAKLTEAVEVTAGGRLIGTWVPATVASGLTPAVNGLMEPIVMMKRDPLDRSFNSRPFTPAPKARVPGG
jgi:hypothetical protein